MTTYVAKLRTDKEFNYKMLKTIIESLFFAASKPLSIYELKNITDCNDKEKIIKAIFELSAEYEARNGGFYLKEVAGGYQLRSKTEYARWIKKLIEPSGNSHISKAALETLSIIAYKQPVLRSDVEHIRGVDSGGVIRSLLDKGLVKIIGRKDIPGRPMLYATTRRFLEVFDLKDLKDLPTLEELGDLAA